MQYERKTWRYFCHVFPVLIWDDNPSKRAVPCNLLTCFQIRWYASLQWLHTQATKVRKGICYSPHLTNSVIQATLCNFHWHQHTSGQTDFHGEDPPRAAWFVTPNCCHPICTGPPWGTLPIKDCSSTVKTVVLFALTILHGVLKKKAAEGME